MKPDGIRPNALTTNRENLIKLDGGITKSNNAFGIFKDSDGNSVYRVDYNNNDAYNIYDEEEVRTPDGKIKSYTKRGHSEKDSNNPNNINYYKKYEYDTNDNLIKVTEIQCDYKGNVISSKELPIDNQLEIHSFVHISDNGENVTDKDLWQKLRNWGANIIGRTFANK